jgi:hypothetical protein
MPVDPSQAKVMPLLIRFLLGVEEPIGGRPEVRDLTAAVCLARDDNDGSPLVARRVRPNVDAPAFVFALHVCVVLFN